MSKNAVMSLWIDPIIGDLQLICIESFLNKGHEFQLFTYNKVINVPNGVIIRDANQIIEDKYVFKDRFNSYATFSDWFRIELLYKMGGWWVDCDVFCLKEFDVNWPYVFATEIANSKGRIQICNAVIKLPKEDIVTKKILDKIKTKLNEKKPNEIKWTEIGAITISDVVREIKLGEYIVDPSVFCPINFFDYKKLTSKHIDKIEESTYGIHLWNKMWEWNKQNLFEHLSKDSYLISQSKK